jgi:hypothetical protein
MVGLIGDFATAFVTVWLFAGLLVLLNRGATHDGDSKGKRTSPPRHW